jgi:phage-related protein
MSTFGYAVSYSSNVSKAPRVKASPFGDGYQQRAGDGININKRVWSVRFTGLPSKLDLIEAFFETENGVTSFDWTPPSGLAGKWLCKQWDRSFDGYNKETITASFEEVFGE